MQDKLITYILFLLLYEKQRKDLISSVSLSSFELKFLPIYT